MTQQPAIRNAVMDAVRLHLDESDRTPVGLPEIPTRSMDLADRIELFVRQAEAAGAQCAQAPDLPSARRHIAQLCAERHLRTIARSDGAVVGAVLGEEISGLTVVDDIENREQLFAADAGITEAQWAIAETGTLVLASGSERHRLTSLLPPTHIAIVPASRMVDTMCTALGHLVRVKETHHAITFVTGPSRTADIELTLVVGVHGPKELHVIVLVDR